MTQITHVSALFCSGCYDSDYPCFRTILLQTAITQFAFFRSILLQAAMARIIHVSDLLCFRPDGAVKNQKIK